jgi:hypothetical protein
VCKLPGQSFSSFEISDHAGPCAWYRDTALDVSIVQNEKDYSSCQCSQILSQPSFVFQCWFEFACLSDNWAHAGGFVVGVISGIAFLPYIEFGKWDKRRKLILSVMAMITVAVGFAVALVIMYKAPDPRFCSWCKYVDWSAFSFHLFLLKLEGYIYSFAFFISF